MQTPKRLWHLRGKCTEEEIQCRNLVGVADDYASFLYILSTIHGKKTKTRLPQSLAFEFFAESNPLFDTEL